MASTYLRKDSPFIWIRFKDANGKWQGKNTGYRQKNVGDRHQAQRLAMEKSLEEMNQNGASPNSGGWEWVMGWLSARFNAQGRTFDLYRKQYWKLNEYLQAKDIKHPSMLSREAVLAYVDWRCSPSTRAKWQNPNHTKRDSAIKELSLLGQIMDEAIRRGYADKNPARRLGIKQAKRAEKVAWSEAEIETVGATLEARDRYGWMHVTFLMGLHQAARLRQAQIPLAAIDFERRVIDYPDASVKGGKGFSQPISPAFNPILQKIVAHRKAIGKSTLCDIPDQHERPASMQWRDLFVSLGLPHLCHHGLRVTWATHAALSGMPEAVAKRFCNHCGPNSTVHAVYQRITATAMMPALEAFTLYRSGRTS
jgi:integrase